MREEDRAVRLINEFADRVQAREERAVIETPPSLDTYSMNLPTTPLYNPSSYRPSRAPAYVQSSQELGTVDYDVDGPPLVPMPFENLMVRDRAIQAINSVTSQITAPVSSLEPGVWMQVAPAELMATDGVVGVATRVETPISAIESTTSEETITVNPSPTPYDNLQDYQQALINKESRPDVMASLYLSMIQYGFTLNTGLVLRTHDSFRREISDSRKVHVFGNSYTSSSDVVRICANLDKRRDTLLISPGSIRDIGPAVLLHTFNQAVAKWFTPVANGVIVRIPTAYQALPEGLLLLNGSAYYLTRKDIRRGFISRIKDIHQKDFEWIIDRGVKPLEPPSRSTAEIAEAVRGKKKARLYSSPENMTFQRR